MSQPVVIKIIKDKEIAGPELCVCVCVCVWHLHDLPYHQLR